MTPLSLLKNRFILKRPIVASFADIIKIATMFIKVILKDSKKVERSINYVPTWNRYLSVSYDTAKVTDFW